MGTYLSDRPRRRSGAGGGVILIVLGVIFLLNQFYGVNLFGVFGTAVGTALGTVLQYWPLLLVLAGAAILIRRD
jgi:hypothetical protein